MMCGGSFCVWSILVAAAFLVSGFALSVKACRLCQLPQRGRQTLSVRSRWSRPAPPKGELWISAGQHKKALPSGELARERLRGFSLLKAGRSFFRSAALSQKAALQMSSPSTTPPVKMGYRNARRRSDIPKFKIILPLTMPKAQRRAFKSFYLPEKTVC